MSKSYCVYIHTNKINGKKYIGLTGQKPNERWHNGHNYKNNRHFESSIKKYGWENFDHEIYASGLTKEEACSIEVELIKKYNTTDDKFGYNLDSGGTYTTHSEQTKEKMRQSALGRKLSDETKEKIRQASKGNKNCLGRHHTEEAKRKNREAHLNTTHEVSDETRKKISERCTTKKPIICVELNKTFPSICEAARTLNGSQGTISSVLLGTRKTAYGYHWKYKE